MLKKISKKIKNMGANLVLISGAIAIIFVSGGILWVSTLKIPHLDSFEQRRIDQSTKIFDRTGEVVLYDVYENTRRTVVSFEDISEYIKLATLAIEDSNFYNHRGIEPRAILRSALVNIGARDFVQGGSTLTQQVVKNSVLTSEKLISRKLKEWIFSIRLEGALEKNDIFEFYLNEIPYGGSIYGIEQASLSFFGKSSSDVTLAEAAYLAALPKAPSYFSPYGSNLEELEYRKNLVLREMLNNEFITEEEYGEAFEEEVQFEDRRTNIRAPHFVMYVIDYIRDNYGEEALERGGLRVTTTLDYELHREAQNIVREYALTNEVNFNAENASLVATNPKTGEILVMVGSRDYFDSDIDGNFNIATAYRQPGSAFKPFAYAEAFNKGYTPDTALFDIRTQFSTACPPNNMTSEGACYSPVNFDNRFRGPVTMREALAQSINVPAVKTLYLAGLSDTAKLAKGMGLENLTDIDRYGLTMVLGGGEVSLLNLSSAYGVFANEGKKTNLTSVLKIEDNDGNVLEEYNPRENRVLDKNISLQISDILSDNEARTPAFGSQSLLHFPGRDVAVKTGTTNEYKDAWIVGYTPEIAVGAWAGNNDNTSMERRIAGLIIAPLWNEFMNYYLNNNETSSFPSPLSEDPSELKPVLRGIWQGGEVMYMDSISGRRATKYTPTETIEEIFVGGINSILHWIDRRDPRGPIPQNPENDSQYENWNYVVRQWVMNQGIEEIFEEDIEEKKDNIHIPQNFPSISITSPSSNELLEKDDPFVVNFNYNGAFSLKRTNIFINNSLVVNNNTGSQTFTIYLDEIDTLRNKNTLTIKVYDDVFNSDEKSLTFNIE